MTNSQDVASIALATALGFLATYAVLRKMMNVDRLLKRVVFAPVVVLALYALAFHQFEWVHTRQSRSLLRQLLELLAQYDRRLEWLVGDLLVFFTALCVMGRAVDCVRKSRYSFSKKLLVNVAGNFSMNLLVQLPWFSTKMEQEMKKVEADIETSLLAHASTSNQMEKHFALPKQGIENGQLLQMLRQLAGDYDVKWQQGRVSGAVYHGEEDHLQLLNKTYAMFAVANPLHADVWPSVLRLEAEVVSMTANLVNGGNDQVCGTLSSGGTESIFLAAKAHREWFRSRFGITKPEIIASSTAHAGIDKACEILKIKLIKVPCDPVTFKMDLEAVKWNITANTIMLYASAPAFPQGIIDDIEALSQIALQNDIGLHVDCCLGGFILPFAKQLFPSQLPEFDFRLPGVTSMSCDTHKYGYAAKGTSVVLYRNKTIRRFQYFAYPDWTGGLYVTPTLAGSRAGALGAAAWASMMRMGHDGYLETTKKILKEAQIIKEGIQKIDGLHVLGDPKLMVVCFGSDDFNIYKVNDVMTKRGWSLNALQHPASVHFCVTVRHVGRAYQFLEALRKSVEIVKQDPEATVDGGGGSAIYGMASSMPAGPVEEILRVYTDITLKV